MDKLRWAGLIIALIMLLGLSFWYWQDLLNQRDDFNLPTGQPSQVTIQIPDSNINDDGAYSLTTYDVMITGGVKHSVPLTDIVGGGPGKDDIPSIDDPKFIDIVTAEGFLDDSDPGIAISINGVNRFYPFQILVWHEIVNDVIDNQPVVITYCPLCLSGVVFDPVVAGEYLEFGVSGKLWNSNLVMYDRKTDSLWSQILGEAIVGEMTGSKLTVLHSDQTNFGSFKKYYPDGQVLSKNTGAIKLYGYDPYGDYYTADRIISRISHRDDRLSAKDFVLGVVVDGQAKAYLPTAIKDRGRVEDEFNGKKLVLEYNNDIDAVRIFEIGPDGGLMRFHALPSFWFSWAAIYQDTALYK